jgi:hypothetical protein
MAAKAFQGQRAFYFRFFFPSNLHWNFFQIRVVLQKFFGEFADDRTAGLSQLKTKENVIGDHRPQDDFAFTFDCGASSIIN